MNLDGSFNWSSAQLLNKTRPTDFNQREVSAVQDSSGTIWVFAGSGDSGYYRPLWYYKSTDGGVTWSDGAPLIIPGERTNDDDTTRLGHIHVVYKAGIFYLVYQTSGQSAIWMSTSTNGTTWSARIPIWSSESAGHMIPKIMVEGSTLYVVEVEGAEGKVYFDKSTDEGSSWTKTHVLGSEVAWGDWDPYIARIPDGRLALVWAPNVDSDGQQLKISYSSDNGTTWSTAENLTTGKSGSEEWWDYWPQILTYSDSVAIFYTSEKDGITDTFNGGNIWQIPCHRTDPFRSRLRSKFNAGATDVQNNMSKASKVTTTPRRTVFGEKKDYIFNG